MNSKDKYLRALQNKPVDSVPVTPIVVQYAASFLDYTIREYTKNPEEIKTRVKSILNEYGEDGFPITEIVAAWVFPHYFSS